MNLAERHKVLLLGSNIQPEIHLPQVIDLLKNRFHLQKVSNVWKTKSVGSDGPDFLNAAVLLDTLLDPQALKSSILRPMESSLGRVRGEEKNAPRTIDIDVVICGNQTLDNDIWEHAHAAVPVAEISPHIRNHPFQGTLGQVAQKLQAEISILKCPEISQQIKSLVEDVPFDPSLKQVNH